MTWSVQRIDQYIANKGYVQLATDSDWQQIVDQVLTIYGANLYYRCIGITQQSDPMRRFFTAFPDNLVVPYRHIKYLELLVADSPPLQQLIDWLHSRGIPTQRVFEDDDEVGGLRIFGYAEAPPTR